jgi:hypothetical protein
LAFTLQMILPTLLETRRTMSIHDCDSRAHTVFSIHHC